MIRLPRTADYFLAVPAFEVTALDRYLELMERNLGSLVDQDLPPEWDGSPEASGRIMVAQLHHNVVSGILPQLFRSSFIVALYAAFEAAIVEGAEVLRQQHCISSPLSTNSGLLRNADKYFRDHFSIELLTKLTREDIQLLKRVRDAIMHANGRKGAMTPRKWLTLAQDQAAGAAFSLDDGYLRLEPAFLTAMMQAVRITLRGFIAAARDSIEQSKSGPHATGRPPLNLDGVG